MTRNPVAFSTPVEQLHRRMDPDSWDQLFVVGDVHGCAEELTDLLQRLDPGDRDLVLFTGDLIRKGPSSNQVVEMIRDRENMTSVRGNNEQKVVRGDKDVHNLSDRNRDYLASLPVAISWGRSLLVHGGIDPRIPLKQQTAEDLLTYRSVDGGGYQGTLWFEQYKGDVRVFFGHTVLSEPIVNDAVVGLDTGCVYGGTLSAYVCGRGDIVSVPSRRTVQERSEDAMISPDDVTLSHV